MRWLAAAPLFLFLVLFALSNRQPVQLTLWPTDFAVRIPLSLTVLAAMAVAFVLGGLVVWIGALGHRRRARRAERSLHALERQLSTLRPPAGKSPGA